MKKLILVLLLGSPAFAQVSCVKWVDSSGVKVGTFCKPFSIKAGGNVVFTDNGFGILTIAATGITASAAGSPSQVQFNTGGGMDASPLLTWDGSALNANYLSSPNLTDQGFLFSDLQSGVDGTIQSTLAAFNGQLLIGNTGNSPQLGSITGTTNQVVVTNGPGTIALSLPQSIGTGSSPTFAQITTSGNSTIDCLEASPPSNPAASHWVAYCKTGVGWCWRNNAGVENCPTNGGGLTSPLTTKGDIWAWSSTNARQAVGTDTQVLTADSSQTNGLKWTAQPASQLFGYCSGVANSSSTLSIQNFGPTSAACTASQVSRAMRMSSAGVIRNLYVVSDAGFNASSGVFTVYKCTVANQVACTVLTTSAISCTIGTGQSCSDTSSTMTVAAGDAVIVKYTTQATETLGNIMVSLEKTVN